MGIDRRSTNFPTRVGLSRGLYLASKCLWRKGGMQRAIMRRQRVKWFRLCFSRSTINVRTRILERIGDGFLGWARRRGVSKRRARLRFWIVMWKGEWLFLKSVFIIHSISWGSYSPTEFYRSLGSCRMIVSRIFILVLIVSTWSFRCSLSLASFSGLYVEDMFRIISSFF